jgi:hypothetical protein
MTYRVLLLLFLVGGACTLFAQNRQYNGEILREFFFERMASARAEAMGRADVAAGTGILSVFSNPTAIANDSALQIGANLAAPLYLLTNANYTFLGGSYRLSDRLVAGVSFRQFAIGESDFDILINGVFYPTTKPRTSQATFTVAATPVKNLSVGANLNMMVWKYLDDEPRSFLPYLDLGARYTVETGGGSPGAPDGITFGLGITNAFFQRIEFGKDTIRSKGALPVIARLGAAYQLHRNISYPGIGEGAFDFLVQAEVQDLLNNEFYSAFRLGTEVVLLDAFAFRLGYFTIGVDDFNNPQDNLSRVNDITFGGGLKIPLKKMSKGKIPASALLDVTILKQPPYTVSGPRMPNFRNFSLTVQWDID